MLSFSTGRELSPEQEILLIMSAPFIKADMIGRLEILCQPDTGKVDFINLYDLSLKNGVSTIIFNNIRKNSLQHLFPPDFISRIENLYNWNITANLWKSDETIRIISLCQKEGIEVIPIKGTVASDIIFGDSGVYRGMGSGL